jgi:hypothetical protein
MGIMLSKSCLAVQATLAFVRVASGKDADGTRCLVLHNGLATLLVDVIGATGCNVLCRLI